MSSHCFQLFMPPALLLFWRWTSLQKISGSKYANICASVWIYLANGFDSQSQKISETPWPKNLGLH